MVSLVLGCLACVLTFKRNATNFVSRLWGASLQQPVNLGPPRLNCHYCLLGSPLPGRKDPKQEEKSTLFTFARTHAHSFSLGSLNNHGNRHRRPRPRPLPPIRSLSRNKLHSYLPTYTRSKNFFPFFPAPGQRTALRRLPCSILRGRLHPNAPQSVAPPTLLPTLVSALTLKTFFTHHLRLNRHPLCSHCPKTLLRQSTT